MHFLSVPRSNASMFLDRTLKFTYLMKKTHKKLSEGKIPLLSQHCESNLMIYPIGLITSNIQTIYFLCPFFFLYETRYYQHIFSGIMYLIKR